MFSGPAGAQRVLNPPGSETDEGHHPLGPTEVPAATLLCEDGSCEMSWEDCVRGKKIE